MPTKKQISQLRESQFEYEHSIKVERSMKTKMTAEQAREYLRGRQYKVVSEDLGNAFLTFANRIGLPPLGEDAMNLLPYPFYISFDGNGRLDEHAFRDHGESCQPIEVLLSIEVVEEPAMWTNEDIDAAYLLGLINSDSINTVDRTAKEIERLKGLGFTRPYEALMAVRYPGQETRADYKTRFEECVELLQESALQIEYLQGKFGETGTGNAVLSKAKQFIQENKGV